jgi:hypothetical protein
MMSFTAMAQDMDSAVNEAVADLVRTKRINGGYFVNLPMLYPDGSFVTIRIDQMPGGVRVSDHGFAFQEIDDVGYARSFLRSANKIAEGTSVQISKRMIFADVPFEQIHRAICEVAEVSWRVADFICLRAFDEDETELSEELNEKLVRLFGEKNVAPDTQIVGASTTEWNVSSVVTADSHTAVFQAVSPYANSIYKASTAFRDLAALDRPPRLIAVVRDKLALGNKLALLAPGRVIEQEQADDLFFRAAA